jgi:multidrug efflux pump subunit AcrA (membrane-fusion protein)
MENNKNKSNIYEQNRLEEVQDIIDRMPTKFADRVCVIVVFLLLLMIIFGWFIQYPDVVMGQVVVNTPVSPIKLVAGNSGQLNLIHVSSASRVKGGQVVALIDNGTSYETLLKIKEILKEYDPVSRPHAEILSKLPAKVTLGELTTPYYTFLGILHQWYNFNTDRIYDKQLASLEKLNIEQLKEIDLGVAAIGNSEENLFFLRKAYTRDSVLFYNRAGSEVELDRAKQSLLAGKTDVDEATRRHINTRKAVQQTSSQIAELVAHKQEKEREIRLGISAAYNDLIDNIQLWEQKYLLRAPFDGRVQFLKFWTDKQFVQQGEPVFTIVPDNANPYGQVMLPVMGAGKVKIGQKVSVKLNDYPFREYGTIKGKITSISLTARTEAKAQYNVETYLATIHFDNGLTTNYGRSLTFKHESTGTAEIITNERRLIERFFDNLSHVAHK